MKYRVIRDNWGGYEVQIYKKGSWIQCCKGGRKTNTFRTLKNAKLFIESNPGTTPYIPPKSDEVVYEI